jgi:outer membrane protein assembly factor BamC
MSLPRSGSIFFRDFFVNYLSKITLWGAVSLLSACTVLNDNKIDYKSTSVTPTLDIPPDLTQLSRDSRYTVTAGTVSASSSQTTGQSNAPVAASAIGDVRIERAGNQRWLVINRPAQNLWEPLREFWRDNGFVLTLDQANLGIMETDWAENRAKIPQDFIRSTLGKVLDSLYSSGERDKFRTRLETNANGGTDIFISHRGMVETYTSAQKDATKWQPRPADEELETEFLRRLMVKLGGKQETASSPAAALKSAKNSTITSVNGQSVLQIQDGFDRAWRRVGLSLDRTGFTVEDRNRSLGIYYVRYVEPNADKSEPGFFSKLISGSKADAKPLKLRITVASLNETTTVSVQNSEGAPETSANTQRILKVIAEDLQ